MAPWARVSGSSTPVTSTLASGNASRNSAMNGIEPPTPMSIGSVPSQASANAARAASYAGPVASIAVGSPTSTGVIVSSAPQGTWVSRWRSRAGPGVGDGVAGCDPEAEAGLGGGDEGVAGAGDLGGVEADDRQRRLGPEPLDGRAAADPADARDGAGLGAQPLLGVVDVGRRPGDQALDGDVAGVVVQAGDQAAERHQRVGDETAPHAGVDGVGEGADLDVEAHQAAQAGGEGGDADVPVAAVGDHDDVGAELVEVLLQQRGQAVGADLLLALDEHHDVDRQVVAVRPAGRRGGRRCRPCRRRRRGRRAARRARSARTAGSPSRRGRSRAGRRGGRRAGRSARPRASPSCGR